MGVYIRVIEKVLDPKLNEFVKDVLRLSALGFNISVRSVDDVLRRAFLTALTLQTQKRKVAVLTSLEELEDYYENHPFATGVVFVTSQLCPKGLGLVTYTLPAIETILPQTNAVIQAVLEQLSLMPFIESFDANRSSLLRKHIAKFGLQSTVDVIAEVALRAGLQGDDRATNEFLKAALEREEFPIQDDRASDFPLENFFRALMIECPQPHGYLKAALSYYVVRIQGATMTHASRTLKISRTTLLDHLKLAEKLQVANHFSGSPLKELNETTFDPESDPTSFN